MIWWCFSSYTKFSSYLVVFLNYPGFRGGSISTILPPNPSPINIRASNVDLGQRDDFIPCPVGQIVQRLKNCDN